MHRSVLFLAANAAACNPPYGFPEAGAGMVACTVGKAYVKCTSASGGGCLCISDDPTQCPGCGASNGFTCTNSCSPGSLGVSCGGPGPNGPSYQSLPTGCTNIGYTPGGVELACCPCGTQ
ncbi:MAG TPA: hypothetical protein VF765_11895 [Polyangiaceae bacterium]